MNVTYLFGAGASAETLPVVKDFNQKFGNFASGFNLNVLEASQSLRNDFIKFANQLTFYKSIDTYARVLFLTGEYDELRRLKFFLSLYFHIEQQNNGVDKRYDLFFGSILGGNSGSPKLPKNVKILTWNYDSQLELSATKFFKSKDTLEVRGHLPLYPKLNGQSHPPSFYDGFLIHKINGSADLLMTVDDKIQPGLSVTKQTSNSKFQVDQQLLEYLKVYEGQGKRTYLTYAWESELALDFYRNEALESIQTTDILVVVGYSFPTFNRAVDKQILKVMSTSLSKIYIQAPSPNDKSILTRVRALMPDDMNVEIQSITEVDEFFLPFEFDGEY